MLIAIVSWLSSREASRSIGGLSETVDTHEKEIIEAALAESKGRVAGPNGAAAKLGVPRLDARLENQTSEDQQASIRLLKTLDPRHVLDHVRYRRSA